MKNLLYTLFAVCILTSCSSSDDDDNNFYSEKQKEALAIMNGTFEDTTFGSDGDDRYRISFRTQYNEPLIINKSGGDILIEAQGECIWHSRGAGDSGEDISCYYEVSVNGTYFSLVHKGGDNDKQLFDRFEIKSISKDLISLKISYLTTPYNFVRKK